MNFFTDLIPQNTNWSKTHNFFYTFQRHKHCENNQNPKKPIQPNKNQTPTKNNNKIEKKKKRNRKRKENWPPGVGDDMVELENQQKREAKEKGVSSYTLYRLQYSPPAHSFSFFYLFYCFYSSKYITKF